MDGQQQPYIAEYFRSFLTLNLKGWNIMPPVENSIPDECCTSKNIEVSDYDKNRIEIEPHLLLCLCCKRGGGCVPTAKKNNLDQVYNQISDNNDLHFTLVGAFDEVGARTPRFYKQEVEERRKDLDVLQRLGLCYGDTRTARDLFARIAERIDNLYNICQYPDNEYGVWQECALAREKHFKCGNKPLPNAQNKEQMRHYKEESCKDILDSDNIVIRAHHLLCILCFIGGNNHNPLEQDNLYEAWIKIKENPDISVTLIEGPQECCICPPCHSFVPERGLCVAACHLRDRKKDLDTLLALGLRSGDTITGKEVYERIFKKIPRAMLVCGYETDTCPEWSSCSSVHSGSYEKGVERGFGFDDNEKNQ